MNKNYIFIITILFTLFLVNSCTNKIINKNEQQDVSTSEKQIGQSEDKEDIPIFGISNQDSKHFETAVKNQDISTCDNIKSLSLKSSCYKNISVEKGDLLICDRIQSSEYKDLCYSDVGVKKQDLSICDKLADKDSKNECYAVIKNDIKLCDKIIKIGYRESCFARITITPEDLLICEKDDKTLTDWCYRDIGIGRHDTAICKKIQNEFTRENCIKNAKSSI